MNGQTYPTLAVARLTGLSIDTLRAWERRYRAVSPDRDARGRVYSEADIKRLRLLREAVARGHAIGRVATLDDRSLEELVRDHKDDPLDGTRVQEVPLTDWVAGALETALQHLDAAAVESALGRAAGVLGPDALLGDVVMPALSSTGLTWCEHRAGIAREHLLSAAVRNALGSLLRVYTPAPRAPRVIFTTPAGERHELGTLGAAVVAASRGVDAVYLGPDLPAVQIAESAAMIQADVVALGVTGAASQRAIDDEVEALTQALSPDVELWVGGPAAAATRRVSPRPLIVSDYTTLDAELARLRA